MDEELNYLQLTAEHAPNLVQLIRDCYGETYASDLFYAPELIAQNIHDGKLLSLVAMTAQGRMVGHVGILREDTNSSTADGITGMVLPEYRQHGVLGKISGLLWQHYLQAGIDGLQLYAVTTHTISQDKALANGCVEVGFLISDFPATMSAEGVADQKLGDSNPSLAMFLSFKPAPARTLYLPTDYAALAAPIYQRLKFPRDMISTVEASKDRFSDSVVAGDCYTVEDVRKQVSRLCLLTIATDWQQQTAAFRARAKAPGFNGWHIDIPLAQPAALSVITGLREEGWFFGGMIFERQQTDYLRMQFSYANINREALNIATDAAWAMVDFVLADRKLGLA